MQTHDERKLVAEIKAGSREAFESFLHAYQDRVYGLVRRAVDVRDAEDVAQEALIQIYRSIGGFQCRSGLSTWVYRVAMNVCLEHRRKKHPEMATFEDDCLERPSSPDDDPSAVAVRSQVRSEIESAIASLPEIHRDVVVLHELQELTYQECAEVLGCPVGTVKSRLSNAFAKLRVVLREYAPESGLAK